MSMIQSICNSCSCTPEEARGYLNDEIRNLRELNEVNDLRIDDFDQACFNLGIELDYVEEMLMML